MSNSFDPHSYEGFRNLLRPTYEPIPTSTPPNASQRSWFRFLFWHGARILFFLILCAVALYFLNIGLAMFNAWATSVCTSAYNAAIAFWNTYFIWFILGGIGVFFFFIFIASTSGGD